MDKLNIKISIANRLYPMNVDSEEERIIRISASKIEKILKNLKEKYSVKDNQDLLGKTVLIRENCVKNKIDCLINETAQDEKKK